MATQFRGAEEEEADRKAKLRLELIRNLKVLLFLVGQDDEWRKDAEKCLKEFGSLEQIHHVSDEMLDVAHTEVQHELRVISKRNERRRDKRFNAIEYVYDQNQKRQKKEEKAKAK